MSAKAVVYTAICGGYDELKEALPQVDVAVDFVAFTDGELPEDRGWLIRHLKGFEDLEPRMLSRLPKAMPHRFFDYREYQYAIWVDGSLEVMSERFVADLLQVMAGSADPLGAWPHPRRDCIYSEAEVSAPLHKYAAHDLRGQVDGYRDEGYPAHNGLLGCTVLVWNLAHLQQAELGERWWGEQEQHGTMDQLSLPVVLWRMGLNWVRMPFNLWENPWFRLWGHPNPPDELRVNLGCADNVRDGFENVDITPGPGVRVVDLRERWPWADGSVQLILAADVIEHLPDKIHTMNEMWRVLSDGCLAQIVVPTTDGPGAFQDPTHVSYWHRNSFKYFDVTSSYWARFHESYGITARFYPMGEQIIDTEDGPKLHIKLAAVKMFDAGARREGQ